MRTAKIQCPAKINLTLEIVNKRPDGFHNIKSIMQLISLYDYLTIECCDDTQGRIILSGNSNEIPYNEKNLVYKAAELFFSATGIKNQAVNIYIEKHIPIAAGLAGGSTDAAGTLFGLNEIYTRPLTKQQLHALCSQLGSDLNVCLEGGTILATSRGENIQKLKTINMPVTLIKPKNLGISAKEAYTKYAAKEFKPQNNMTEKMIKAIDNDENIKNFLYNDLEYAVFNDYPELQYIKTKLPNSVMSGSGSTYFILGDVEILDFGKEYQIINGLHFINNGISIL